MYPIVDRKIDEKLFLTQQDIYIFDSDISFLEIHGNNTLVRTRFFKSQGVTLSTEVTFNSVNGEFPINSIGGEITLIRHMGDLSFTGTILGKLKNINSEFVKFSNLTFNPGSEINVATYSHAQFENVIFKKTGITDLVIEKLVAKDIQINNSYLRNISFNNCELSHVKFLHTRIDTLDLRGCKLDDVSFDGIQLRATIYEQLLSLK